MSESMDKLYQLHSKLSDHKYDDLNITIKAIRDSVVTHYKTLYYSLPLCIYEIDLDGNILSMNPAGLKMLNLNDESEIIGVNFLKNIHEIDLARITKLFKDAVEKGITSKFLFKGANNINYCSCFVPIKNDEKEIVSIVGYSQDVTNL